MYHSKENFKLLQASKRKNGNDSFNPTNFEAFKRRRVNDNFEAMHCEASKEELKALTKAKGLSEGQARAMEAALSGESFFFTGSAGTGKSFCLKAIVEELRKRKVRVALTATTGAAAVLIGGMTLHSWSGIGATQGEFKSLLKKIKLSKRAMKNWRGTDTLIIDEISMLDGKLFDSLERVARSLKESSLPFGGMQLIMCGDFAQLPPVNKSRKLSGNQDPPSFAFQSRSWNSCLKRSILLTRVFRQKDHDFLQLLNEVRFNRMSTKSISLIESSINNDLSNRLGILPTKLFARNRDVDRLNNDMLKSIPGSEQVFLAKDWAASDVYLRHIKRNASYPDKLMIKPGAQVMLLKNIDFDSGLVNGARGVVREILSKAVKVQFLHELVVVEMDKLEITDGIQTIAYRKQLPLKLAWAITIHKSQGSTCDLLEVDLKGCFEVGQAYTALSRSSSYNRLRVCNFNRTLISADPQVVKFHQRLFEENGLDFDSEFPSAHLSRDKTSVKAEAPQIRYGLDSMRYKENSIKSQNDNISFTKPIKGSTFCMTGISADPALTREGIKRMIEEKGGSLKTTVSSRTDYLIAGAQLDPTWARGRSVESSSKYKKALELGTKILSEPAFLELYHWSQ